MNDEVRADYQMAGELFGRLEFELGFGFLSMYRSERLYVFVYRWGFKAKGEPYSCQRQIDMRSQRLFDKRPLDMVAQQIAYEWKAQHQHVTEEKSQ